MKFAEACKIENEKERAMAIAMKCDDVPEDIRYAFAWLVVAIIEKEKEVDNG